MSVAPRVITAAAATTILLGLTSIASANAAQPAASTPVVAASSENLPEESSASKVDSTRRFTVTNFSGHSLTINDIWGTTGWPYPKKTGFNPYDEFPLAGSVLQPGQQMTFEIKDWSDHGITVKFRSDNGQDVHVYMHVSGLSRYSDAKGLEGQFIKGGGDVTILDKPGLVTFPASDPAGQAKALNTLCSQSTVQCSFTPTQKSSGFLGPAHPYGRGMANLTPDPQMTKFTDGDTVETSTSLELSASVKVTVMGAVEAGLTNTYRQEWKTSHTFAQETPLTVRPSWVGWLTAQEPMVRFTGDMTIKLKDAPNAPTTWKVEDLVFDVPDRYAPKNAGLIAGFAREMTQQEVDEAWRSGGFVQAPWKAQFPSVATAIPTS